MTTNRKTTWMGSGALSRRQLLGASTIGALGALGMSGRAGASIPFSLTNPAGPRPNPGRPAGADLLPQIEHIVVVMMENHSYDNILGTLSRGNGLTFTDGDPRPTNTNSSGPSGPIRSFAMPTTAQDPSPSQDWVASWTQFLGSPTAQSLNPAVFNTGFVESTSGPVAMGYFTPEQLPFLNWLGETYPIADAWHCSCLGQTDANRRFSLAGTSLGQTNDQINGQMPQNGTIFMSLMEHEITWTNYFNSLPSSLTWVEQLKIPGFTDHLKSTAQFFIDAAAGHLPSFTWVDPNFADDSGEDPQDLQHADVFLRAVINAIQKSPTWDKTMVVWTFDEHGGYYDHVPPPTAPAPDGFKPPLSGWQGNPSIPSFGRLGFRVPSGVVSPYAIPDHVSSTVYDHTSIMKLVEEKWNLPSFTARDRWATSPLDMIDLSAPPAYKKPPAISPPARDTKGNVVSIGLTGNDAPTADEVRYPNDGQFVPGKGYLYRQEYYVNKAGTPIPSSGITPYYRLLEDAWEA